MLSRSLVIFMLLIPTAWAYAGTAGEADDVVAINEKATDAKTCDAKWNRFWDSQECLAPFQNVNGTWKPGAFEKCPVYSRPDECPSPSSLPASRLN